MFISALLLITVELIQDFLAVENVTIIVNKAESVRFLIKAYRMADLALTIGFSSVLISAKRLFLDYKCL